MDSEEIKRFQSNKDSEIASELFKRFIGSVAWPPILNVLVS